MRCRITPVLGASALCLAMLAATNPAKAGPCSDAIAELGRKMAQSPALGPVTTGTLTGSNPGSAPIGVTTGSAAAPSTAGTSADTRIGGTAGTKEMNAAAGTIATSPQDVRRQQEGLPTAAAVAGSGKSVEMAPVQGGTAMPNDKMSMAKMELERARMLDQKDDGSCSGAVDKARELAG